MRWEVNPVLLALGTAVIIYGAIIIVSDYIPKSPTISTKSFQIEQFQNIFSNQSAEPKSKPFEFSESSTFSHTEKEKIIITITGWEKDWIGGKITGRITNLTNVPIREVKVHIVFYNYYKKRIGETDEIIQFYNDYVYPKETQDFTDYLLYIPPDAYYVQTEVLSYSPAI